MQSYIARVLALVFLLAGSPVSQGRAVTVEEGASTTFAQLKQAVAAREGATAARYIDDRTADFYEGIRRAALKMPKHRLLRQALFFQVEVLAARLFFSREQLERADGRDVYARLVAAGAAGSFGQLALVKIEPTRTGASAIVQASLPGQRESIGLRVFTEGGGWKIDLSRLLEAETRVLQNKMGVTPKTPRAIQSAVEIKLFPLISQGSDQPASARLWAPLAGLK